MSKITVYQWGKMPRQKLLDGALSRTALRSDNSIVTFNWFEPGTVEPPPHQHPFDQLSLVVTGQLVFTVGKEVIVANAGTALRIPAGVPHTARQQGNQTTLNIDIFAPVRDDYLFLTEHQTDFFKEDRLPKNGFGVE